MAVSMIERIQVLGRGRVGSAAAARLGEQGLLSDASPELVLLCVPDSAIADVAAGVPTGPWIAHVSGATPLAALAPHTRRFSLHPLQTFDRSGLPGQFDGAWGAVTADTADGRACGVWLAARLGLRAFELADEARAIYHAGAVMASNYLVTLYRAAARACDAAAVPAEALVPLMRRTIDNGFDLTGPIARGDWATVDRHLAALRAATPDLEPLYRALADATTAAT
jgi:predicted short-subunit dehydrogenase-like oxidoreductase (DUF2520 family)